jgi:DNA-binding SARP family transcriptional activator
LRRDVDLLILGPLEVRAEGVLLPLGGAKPRAMLATLLLHPNEVVSVDRLTDALWGDQPPPSAAANIKTYASQLRKAVDGGTAGSRLVTRSPGYLFRVEPGELDLVTFEALAESGRSALAGGDFELAASQLGEALSLWRGEVCADVALGPELDVARSSLDERRMAVTEDCLEARLHRGEHRELVPELRGLVAAHPLRERLWEYLMLALTSAGRQADALAAYTACRAAFVRELGLEPSPRLRNLQTAILANDAPGPDRPERPLPGGAFQSSWPGSAAPAAPEPVPVSPGSAALGPSLHPPLVPAQVGNPPQYALPQAPALQTPVPQTPLLQTPLLQTSLPQTSLPQRRSPLGSRPWRIRHSLWLLPALLGFGFWTWLSFLYIGIRARRRDWVLIAVAYVVLLVVACIMIDVTHPGWISTVGGCLWLLGIWGGGSVHAVLVNRAWLRWRSDSTPWYLT